MVDFKHGILKNVLSNSDHQLQMYGNFPSLILSQNSFNVCRPVFLPSYKVCASVFVLGENRNSTKQQ